MEHQQCTKLAFIHSFIHSIGIHRNRYPAFCWNYRAHSVGEGQQVDPISRCPSCNVRNTLIKLHTVFWIKGQAKMGWQSGTVTQRTFELGLLWCPEWDNVCAWKPGKANEQSTLRAHREGLWLTYMLRWRWKKERSDSLLGLDCERPWMLYWITTLFSSLHVRVTQRAF